MAIIFGNADLQLQNTAQPIFSAGQNSSLLITRLTIVNTDTVSHGVTIYRVFNGGTPSTANEIVNSAQWPGLIAPGETIAVPLTGHNISNGQAIYAMADTSAVVNMSVSYIEQDNNS